MSETEAVSIAVRLADQRSLKHAGVRHAVFVPLDSPFHGVDEHEIWLVYLELPSTPESDLLDTGEVVIAVDNETARAEFRSTP